METRGEAARALSASGEVAAEVKLLSCLAVNMKDILAYNWRNMAKKMLQQDGG